MSGAFWTPIPVPPHPQSLLAMSPEKRKLAAQEGRPTEAPPEEQPEENLHTLEEFSYEFFRCPPCSIPGPPPQPALLCSLGTQVHESRCSAHLGSLGREGAL